MTPGFHWFVAWRYLMARPRRASAAIVAVAGGALIVSAALSAAAKIMGEHGGGGGLMPLLAHRNALMGAVVLVALAAAGLLTGIVSFTRQHPGRIGVPLLRLRGAMLSAVGLVAHGAPDAATRQVATILLVAAAVLLAIGLLRYWMHARARSAGPFTLAGLMLLGATALATLAEQTLEPAADVVMDYHGDWLLVPGLGLLVLGLGAAAVAAVRSLSGRPLGRVMIAIAVLAFAASALWPLIARSLLDEAALVQDVPTGARMARHVWWLGLGMLGVTALVAVSALGTALATHYSSKQRRRRGAGVLQLIVPLALMGAACLGLSRFVLDVPEYAVVMIQQGDRVPDEMLVLVGVGFLAVAELALMLGVIRHFFTFFTTVSIAGVAIGSMALVIVLSVMSGFENDLRTKILGSNAHILVTKDEGSFTEYRDIAARIESVPGVVATSPYLISDVGLTASNNYHNVIIKGVDPATVGRVTELDDSAEQPRAVERMWPLADDGSIIGPPSPPAGVDAAAPAGPGANDAGAGKANAVDPPPPDLDVNIGEPMDFSGGEAPGAPEAGERAAAVPGADAAAVVDPPPPDLDVDFDEPMDFSGTEQAGDGESATRDAGADVERGSDGLIALPDEMMLRRPILDLDDEDAMPRISPRVARLPGILVGKELVKQIHLYVGQEVRVVSPLAEDTPAGPVPRTRLLRVAGTFFTGMYEYDLKFVYVPIETLQSFLDLGDEVTGIEIRIGDPDDTGPILSAIRARLPAGYRVQDWKELNRSLFSALMLEKIAMFLVLTIIFVVASFSIIGNLIMVVVEKAREIALIKTLGASNAGVMQIFVAQGFFIGLVGTLMGVAHGLLACVLGDVYGLPLNPEVYYIDRLPIHIESGAVVAVAVAGIVISVVATLYPAAIGARQQPIEGLRYE